MKVDIIVFRDPDAANEVWVYVDGKPLGDRDDPHVSIVDIDPGRGWEAEDWDSMRDHDAETVHPDLADQVRQWYDEIRDDSPYIEGK